MATITETIARVVIGQSEPACEHPAHGGDGPGAIWHKDGNPHYIRFIAECGHYGDGIAVVCGEWVKTLRGVYCGPCDAVYPAAAMVEVIGRVNDYGYPAR